MARVSPFFALSLCLLLANNAARTAQAGVITNVSHWNGGTALESFGEPSSATIGQIFTLTGLETTLDSFSFWLRDHDEPVTFAAYIMEWDDALRIAIGDVLFESSIKMTTNNRGLDGFEKMTFATGGLDLTAGVTYVAFMSASKFFDGERDVASVGLLNESDNDASSYLVYQNNGSDFPSVARQGWFRIASGDLAFEMTVSEPSVTVPEAVPEPSSLVLLALGSLGAMWGARRRQTQQATR